jgi:hypothetical protein
MFRTVLIRTTAAHLQRNPGMYAAVADGTHHPETTRVLTATAEEGTDVVRFLVSRAASDRFLAAAAAGNRACIVAASLADYETLQYKGDLVEVRDANDDEVAALHRSVDAFCALVGHVGIDPTRYRAHLEVAPFATLRLRVDSVFDQTPRVGAGELVSTPGGQP